MDGLKQTDASVRLDSSFYGFQHVVTSDTNYGTTRVCSILLFALAGAQRSPTTRVTGARIARTVHGVGSMILFLYYNELFNSPPDSFEQPAQRAEDLSPAEVHVELCKVNLAF